jgi:hypothetical protein
VLPALAAVVVALTVWMVTGPLRLAGAAETPLSQGKPATASSVEGANWAASKAVDGDTGTRWSSAFSDPQWLQVDLGGQASLTRVVLNWEAAYATAFQIMVSTDGNSFSAVYSTTTGTGGTQALDLTAQGRYVRLYATARVTQYGVSLFEFQVYGSMTGGTGTPTSPTTVSTTGTPSTSDGSASAVPSVSSTLPSGAPGSGYVLANPQVTGVTPSTYNPPHAYFHEFQANCSVSRHQRDDPIVFFNQPGMSHDHTFMGNITTNAASTLDSLLAGNTLCKAPGDRSGYWMPTMYIGDQVDLPDFPQVIYYKTGVNDYTSVRPWPQGLRFVVGSPIATAAQFRAAPGYQKGWECGDSYDNIDFPATCPPGQDMNIRMQSPSCWNGLYLDTPDHKSHMAYPVDGVCPADHPVAVPMIEFKMAFPVPANGDMSSVRLSSGRGYSFHYDFYNAWDPATLSALVTHCVNGGLQCSAQGYDETQAGKGAALDDRYQVPGTYTALDRGGWTATASVGGSASNVLDGNADSRWTSGASMANGQSLTIDMKASHPISEVSLLATGADWARGYTVYLSNDGQSWTAVTSNQGVMDLIVAPFATQNARYIKVVQTGTASNWWSVAEFTAYSHA